MKIWKVDFLSWGLESERPSETMAIPRLAWVEIESEAVKNNIRLIKDRIGPSVALMGVVKANAYGHGAVGIAKILQQTGADRFGVSSFYEAKELRQAGISLPIVILGYTPAENHYDAVENDITITIKSPDVAKAMVTAARRLDKIAKVWIKVDTGMHRLGLEPDQVTYFIKKIIDLPNLEVEGIFTHFADADSNKEFTELQFNRFKEVLEDLKTHGIDVPIKSAAASAATLKYPEMHLDMVRVGLANLGLRQSKTSAWENLKPVLSFKTEVVQVHELDVGESVGYGRAFIAERPARIATLAVGYGDGFRRAPFNWGEVLIRGKRALLAGRVSMDQAAVDITDINEDIRAGEEVVLIGKSGNDEITAEEVAEKLQTSVYEVVTALTTRVTRIYK